MADPTPDDAAKKAQDDIKRIQSALEGMTKGLKINDLESIASIFAGFTKDLGEAVSDPEHLKSAGTNLKAIAYSAMGLKDADKTKETISNIRVLMDNHTIMEDKFVASYLRRQKYELEINNLTIQKIAAESEGGLKTLVAMWAMKTKEITEKTQQIFGAGIAGAITPMLGVLGTIAIVMQVLQMGVDQLRLGLDAVKPAMASTGIMVNQSLSAYTSMIAQVNLSIRSFSAAGFDAKQASDLLAGALKENAIQIGYNALQEQNYTGTIEQRGLKAMQITSDMTFEIGRLSQSMFGSATETKRLIEMTNLYRITNTETLKIVSTGLTQLAGVAGVDGGLVVDAFNNMGTAMMGTGVQLNDVARAFVPFISNLRNFGKEANLSGIEVVGLMKGLGELSKGVNNLNYMAVKGMSGNLETMLGEAYGTTALSKAKSIAEMATKISAEGGYGQNVAGLIGSKLGIGAGLSEPMQAQMTKFLATTDMKKFEGKSQEEVSRAIFGVKQGNEEFQSRVAAGELMGMDIQKQMLAVLEKSLGWLIKMATGIGGAAERQEARAEIEAGKRDKQMSQRSGNQPYHQNITSAMG